MKTDKKNKIVMTTIGLLFIGYLGLYFAYGYDYFEFQEYRRTVMTREQIERFEADVLAGNPIDIESYITGEPDFSNRVSWLGNVLTNAISRVITASTLAVFQTISSYVTES